MSKRCFFCHKSNFSDDGDNTKKYKSSFVLGDAIGKKMNLDNFYGYRGHAIEDAEGQKG